MTGPVRLIETVRVIDGTSPLWERHLRRLRRSAAALGIPLGPLAAPSGHDRIIRICAGMEGIDIEERPVPVPAALPVALAAVPHPGYPHKTDRRAAFEAALREAEGHGAGEALLLSRTGWIAEGSYTTVLWWEDHGLAAPPLELGILPSIARERIAALAGGLTEMRATPGDLRGRAIFLANAARGIMEVVSLQGESVRQDPRTAALAARFWP
jgi:branched-subunit amino acid aminotransferase/4-amino-4-deoxychorismate lyase